jgi:hypothetical protein
VPGRELDALGRQQIDERIVLRRGSAMHRLEHALILLRAGDREHVGEALADLLGLRAHAACDDDLAVLGERGADRIERFCLRAFEEAAGVHDRQISALVLSRELVSLRAQPRDDAFGIDQRLRAAERDETDLGGARIGHGSW